MSSIVVNGVIQQLSVSQAEKFDPRQVGGCPTRWFLESVHDQKPDQHDAQKAGESGHELFAHYFRNGKLPDGRKAMRKTVDYAILKGDLPKPGADMLVEWRGDGQEKFSPHTCGCKHPNSAHADDGKGKCTEPGCKCEEQKPLWIPLLKSTTLWLGGIPWELFIDLTYRRGPVPTVIDHKFSSDPETYGKPDEGLINTIQMPVYVLGLLNRGLWTDARLWELKHNYNRKTSGVQFFRGGFFSMDQILERKADIEERVVPEMKAVARATDQRDVPFNRRSCDAWHGCPHQSICHAFKENKPMLTDKEAALFTDLEKKPETTAPTPPAPELDEEAKLEAEFAARKAKIAADKAAKAELEKKAAEAEAKRQTDEAAAAAAAKAAGGDQKVLPDDAPESKPELASEQPTEKGGKGKGGKKAAQPGVSMSGGLITITIDMEQLKALLALAK